MNEVARNFDDRNCSGQGCHDETCSDGRFNYIMEIENDKRFDNGGSEQWEEFDGGSCNGRSCIDRNCNDGRFNYMEIGNDTRFDNGGFDGRNSTVEVATMENSIMEIATIEIATMEDSVAWKLETIEDSIMEVSNERWKLQRWKIQLQRSCNDLIITRSHFAQNYHRVRNAIVE